MNWTAPPNTELFRDTSCDRESLEETVLALAQAIHGFTFRTPVLIPASVAELIEALRIDYDNGGFFDTGTFACGICLANGTTYQPWSDEALQWLKAHAEELQVGEFVGPREEFLNLCPECAEFISGELWRLPGSSRAARPGIDIFSSSAPPQDHRTKASNTVDTLDSGDSSGVNQDG